MPVRNVGHGYKCGGVGKIYHYKKSVISKRNARRKAQKQCLAIHLSQLRAKGRIK